MDEVLMPDGERVNRYALRERLKAEGKYKDPHEVNSKQESESSDELKDQKSSAESLSEGSPDLKETPLEKLKKIDLIHKAEDMGLEVEGLTKAEIVEAIKLKLEEKSEEEEL